MMPIKEILETKTFEAGPPVLIVDETTISRTVDAGPVCGCYEKFFAIQDYKPFVPGGVNPYKRRVIPNSECLEVEWKNIRIGTYDFNIEKPVAMHFEEIPENYKLNKKSTEEQMTLTRIPVYSEEYFLHKLRECDREHVSGCKCPCKTERHSALKNNYYYYNDENKEKNNVKFLVSR